VINDGRSRARGGDAWAIEGYDAGAWAGAGEEEEKQRSSVLVKKDGETR